METPKKHLQAHTETLETPTGTHRVAIPIRRMEMELGAALMCMHAPVGVMMKHLRYTYNIHLGDEETPAVVRVCAGVRAHVT